MAKTHNAPYKSSKAFSSANKAKMALGRTGGQVIRSAGKWYALIKIKPKW